MIAKNELAISFHMGITDWPLHFRFHRHQKATTHHLAGVLDRMSRACTFVAHERLRQCLINSALTVTNRQARCLQSLLSSLQYMRGRLQHDPEEVWVFGFGSIIYKQGNGSGAVQGSHRATSQGHTCTSHAGFDYQRRVDGYIRGWR